jgi:hypothetical protein
MQTLDKASEMSAPYPHDFITNGNQAR